MSNRNSLTATLLLAVVTIATSTMAQDAPAPSIPKSHRMPMRQTFSYSCDGNAKVVLLLRERNAQVSFHRKEYAMKQVEAASGTKYSDGSIVWWSKGEEGFLEDATKPDHPVRLADHCKLEHPPVTAAQGIVSGGVKH
jgi:membrane-bound inhibitor of C-type lysozyme